MTYKIEEMEDQIIEHLQAQSALSDVTIATHAGTITGAFFQNPELMEGLITSLPFIFIQYQGKTKSAHSSEMTLDIHKPVFRFYIGAQSLRATKESQRSAYSILRALYDALHGKYFNYTGVYFTDVLSGTQITTSMSQQQPLTEGDGVYERLMVCLPRIVVYSVDYNFQVIA